MEGPEIMPADDSSRASGWRSAWLVASAAVVVSLVLLRRYVFGGRLWIFHDIGCDTLFQYWPCDHYFAQLLKGLTLTFWSFKIGMGTQIDAMRDYLDPYKLLVYVLPAGWYPYALVYKAILESVGAALAWMLYLRRLRVTGTAVLLASLAFGFNGYLALWGQHYQFGFIFTILPLVLFAFEVFLKEGRPWPLVFFLAYFLSWSYWFFYYFSIFFALYIVVRYVSERGPAVRPASAFLVRLLGVCALAALLSAWTMVPRVLHTMASPRFSPGIHPGVLALFPAAEAVAAAMAASSIPLSSSSDNWL